MTDNSDLKILHMVAGAERGGAETFCLDAICALHDAGVKQHVICRPHAPYINALEARGISYDRLGYNRLDKLWAGPALVRKRARDFKPTLVHAWMGRAASFVPAGLGVPVLGWFGGYYDLKRYRTSDYYMGVTRDLVRHITESSGTPERVFLGHTFGTLEPSPAVDRKDLDTPEDAKVILLLSRMHQKKGVDTLLQAALQVPDAYFWLAGDGPLLDDYKAMCTKLGLDDRVRFLGWRDDRAALLEQAAVCTLPSRYEPFGTVMPEAWHAGVPLVAARAAGPSAYVEDDVNGLLCDIDDVDGLAKQLNRALHDEDLRRSLIENGTRTYEETFSRAVVVKELLAAYRTIASGGSAKAAAA